MARAGRGKRSQRKGRLSLVRPGRKNPLPTAWVDDLEPWFWQKGLRFHGAPEPTLATCVAASVDQLATSVSLLYGISAVPRIWWRGIDTFFENLAFYRQPAFLEDPGRFFLSPPENVVVHERLVRRGILDPSDGDRVMIEFESPFETVNPERRDRYRAYAANRKVTCRAWLHRDGQRPAIVCIHGFAVPDYSINTELFWARELFELGLDVILFTLPFHGSRSEPDQWFHGQNFVGLSLGRLNEASAQAIMDLRVLLAYLRKRGHPMVGVTGYSLGGYHTALLAGVEPTLDFAIPAAPVVTIADLMFEWPIGRVLSLVFWNHPETVYEFRRVLAAHTPLSHPLAIPKEKTFLVGALGDRMAPPSHTHLLWEHWDHPRVHWTSGGHLLLLDRSEMFRDLVEFLRDIGVVRAPAERATGA